MVRHKLLLSTLAYMAQGGTGAPIWSLVKVTASSILEVIILSSVGYLLARRGIIDKKMQTKINKLNVTFFTPALLFSKVAFTLNPARLAELFIVPIGFVIVTLVSTFSAFILSWLAGLSKAQRNFALACAISPNSNSLPVALMQSLVVTVPQLHWDEEGEPEDTVDGMLGRALTYLVLYSTLGMFLRWSIGAKLLATVDQPDQESEERRLSDPNTYRDEPASDRLVDYGQHQAEQTGGSATRRPHITLRRPTGEVHPNRKRSNPAWACSFPNSPDTELNERAEQDYVEDIGSDDDELPHGPIALPGASNQRSTFAHKARRTFRNFVIKPLKTVGGFMTAPLYAAIISLVVALIGPLQKFIDSLEPLVGALESAGSCSIPLTMVVLGAYFNADASAVAESRSVPPVAPAGDGPADIPAPELSKHGGPSRSSSTLDEDEEDPWRRPSVDGSTTSADGTLVQKDTKRKGISWNPWSSSSNSSSTDIENGRYTSEPEGFDGSVLASRNADLNSRGGAGRKANAVSKQEEKEKHPQKMERRTIAVAIGSRMILTPLILLPCAAWYAIATRYNVMDDPVFITSACLIIGSPPALTLAQITSQSATGDSGFERLISKTIFVSYAILAAPTTIALVLTALLIAEYDH